MPGDGRGSRSALLSGLRFAMVTTFYPPYNFGGDGMGVLRLSRALVRRGHHVTVIHDADAYEVLAHGPAPRRPAGDDIEVMTLHSRLGAVSCLLTQQTGRPLVHGARIARALDAGGFDVINFHNVSLVGGPWVLGAGHGVKVYMAHDHWLVCPSHTLWRHGREICTDRQCLRCVLHYRRPPQLWRYTGYLERELRHVDAFIAMSEFSRAKHREFGFPRDMDVVPYFLEPDGVNADPGPPLYDRPYFLFVGRLERIKGLDDVIPVFRDYPGADLLVAGEGEHGPTLRRLAAGAPRVKFLGWVPPERLARYYQHAVALIVPSVCFETFGIVIIEAFRHGTPVLARRIGPFPEIMERARGGELFWSADELVAAMRRLETKAGYRERLGRAAREAVECHWSERAVMPQYLESVRRAALAKGAVRVVERLDAAA